MICSGVSMIIIVMRREQVERTSSMSGFQSENLSNSKGSSTKSLILGSTGTDVDIMENEEKIYRFAIKSC